VSAFTAVSASWSRWILAALLASLGYVAYSQPFGGMSLGGAPSPLESRYHTEEEWLVDGIVRDVAEMGFYARHHRAPGQKDFALSAQLTGAAGSSPVRVTISAGTDVTLTRDLPLSTFIWSPQEYEPVAAALIRSWRLEAAAAADATRTDDALLLALADPRGAVIERENQRASAELAANMTDPARHEAAALILASLGLRERAEAFTDVRPVLCRMTAHLAFARALRGGARYGVAGQYAELALLAMAGRGAEAEQTLTALKGATTRAPGQIAWLNALELRIKADPRSAGAAADETLLERLELFSTLIETRNTDLAVEAVPHEDAIPDWARIIRQGNVPSVQTSNELTFGGLELELAEVRDVWTLARHTPLPENLASVLNAGSERAITAEGPRVIGWGTWAATFQRHICAHVLHQDTHLRRNLGLPEQADAAAKQAEALFAGLTLFPFVDSRLNMNADRSPDRFDEAVTLAIQHPELIAPANWWGLEESARYEVIRRGAPQRAAWFSPGLPRGTTHDFSFRRTAGLVKYEAASLAELKALSPRDIGVIDSYLAVRYGDELQLADMQKEYGERAEYDTTVLWRMAAVERDTAQNRKVLARLCDIDADACASVGATLVQAGDDDAAAKAYQRMFDSARDRVLTANSSRWLMDYYYDRAQRGKAREIATNSAQTGSARGMLTLSAFLEREGDYAGAENLLQAIKDRYSRDHLPSRDPKDPNASSYDDWFLGFYYRMAVVRGDRRYQAKFDALALKIFPKGLERIEIAHLDGHPEDGVSILTGSGTIQSLGLRSGDIIVGLDGWRVHNLRQYRAIAWFYAGVPEIKLVAWHYPGYTEANGRLHPRDLGVEMRSYEPKAGTGE
jgi:hypothetical protein